SVFFFSSRRRHTRLQGDWSSDVCSSDLDWLCCPGHPYGRTSLGTESSIAKITREASIALWQREVVADNLIVGLAGDIDHASAQALVDRLVARLPQGTRMPIAVAPAPAGGKKGRRVILVDKPDRTQAQIRIG